MLFNSIDFALFLPVVFVLYWFVASRSAGHQNLLLVAASYLFYGWWDWRFLSLIFASTLVDYFVARGLADEKNETRRKVFLWTSISVNLGILGFFKYYNFFLENLVTAFSFFGMELNGQTLNIILPVGISFYTFQTLSYSIDVYKRVLKPTKDFVSFVAYVSFFPQLVAGPIERATHLLVQFRKKRTFDYHRAVDGLRQMLWGFFKKVVIADNCADYANLIFDHSGEYSGSTLALGALFFAFQIYGDFSGYSDIAIGTGRLFGIDLMRNFAFPYFSRDIAEFWRRWHISLTTWFRDYLYIPLGGSRGGLGMQIRNIFVIFIVSGFWHGAKWNFIAWGALNAIYFLPLLLIKRNRQHLDVVAQGKKWPGLRDMVNMAATFCLTLLAWVFFRAENMTHAFHYLNEMFSSSIFTIPEFRGLRKSMLSLGFVFLFVLIEWQGREEQYAIKRIGLQWKTPFRWALYYGLLVAIVYFMEKEQEFIYFQF